MAVRQTIEQFADFSRERMISAVAGAVEPPDFTRRSRCGQGMQHRKHRGRSDPGGQQDDRAVAVGQEECASRGRDVDTITDAQSGVDVAAGRTVGFAFDTDAVDIRGRVVGQRVVADQVDASGI